MAKPSGACLCSSNLFGGSAAQVFAARTVQPSIGTAFAREFIVSPGETDRDVLWERALCGSWPIEEFAGRDTIVPWVHLSRLGSRRRASIPPLELVGHTSGAQTLECLDEAREQGADTFSIHPLQTIPDPETSLAGAPCAIAGSSPRAERAAEELAAELGMAPFSVPDEVRAAYHAAASMASNFLVTLEESAAELLEQAGVDNARELLAPLVLRTAANWAERGDSALTGPIVRGDEQTVEQHRTAIASVSPTLAPLYDALAERTLEIAAWRKELD